jgi:hypothetical protein
MPIEWMVRIKESIRTLSPQFLQSENVEGIYGRLYMPAIESRTTSESTKSK